LGKTQSITRHYPYDITFDAIKLKIGVLEGNAIKTVSTLSNDYTFIGWKQLHISEVMLIISVLLLVLSN
jgi:hypothetical protein